MNGKINKPEKPDEMKGDFKMEKFYAILNDTTAAPATKIDEDHELRFELVEGTEEEIHEQAYEQGATRVHLYEAVTDDYDMTTYNYVTTQASKYTGK